MDAQQLKKIRDGLHGCRWCSENHNVNGLLALLDEALELLDAVLRYPCDVGSGYCHQHYEGAPCPVGRAREFVERLMGQDERGITHE